MPRQRKIVTANTRADMLKFVATATNGPFGMVLFYVDPQDEENMKVANMFKHIPDIEVSDDIVNSAHAMFQLYQHMDVEEIHELLLDRGVMCFGTETEGEA